VSQIRLIDRPQVNNEWMGDVPPAWNKMRVRYLFEIKKRIAGRTGLDVLSITQSGIKKKDIESGDGQLSSDYSKYQLVDVGDFAMNHMDLLTGYIDVSPYAGVTSPDYRVFTIRDKSYNKKYFLYVFQFLYLYKVLFPLGQGSSHLGRWRLQSDSFNNIFLPVPPVPEQNKIVKYLDTELEKIREIRSKHSKLLKLLEEKRLAIINTTTSFGTMGLAASGEYSDRLPTMRVKYIFSLNDEALSSKTDPNYEFEYIDISSVNKYEGIKQTESMKFADAPSRARRIVRKNDIILGAVRTYLEAIALIGDNADRLIASTGFAVLRPKQSDDAEYLSYALRAPNFMKEVGANSVGVSYPAINIDRLSALSIPYPSRRERAQIVKLLKVEMQKMDQLKRKSEIELKRIREREISLIYHTVTGRIHL